jgi:hypothetical protein
MIPHISPSYLAFSGCECPARREICQLSEELSSPAEILRSFAVIAKRIEKQTPKAKKTGQRNEHHSIFTSVLRTSNAGEGP